MTGLCERHQIEAFERFGNTDALSHLAVEFFGALTKDLGFQARVERAWQGEDRSVAADARTRRRVQARLDQELTELLSVLGYEALCCYLGQDTWRDLIAKTQEWVNRGGDPKPARTANGAAS